MMATSSSTANGNNPKLTVSTETPHAFHQNLPSHHHHQADAQGQETPYVTEFAERKARQILRLAFSIQLSPRLLEDQPLQQQQGSGADGDNARDTTTTNNVESGSDDDDDDDEEEMDDEQLLMVGSGDNHLDDNNATTTTTPGGQQQQDEQQAGAKQETMATLTKKCLRLQAQLTSLETFKYCGISSVQFAVLMMHLLRLLSCTVTYQDADEDAAEATGTVDAATTATRKQRKATLHYENVGYLMSGDAWVDETTTTGKETTGSSSSFLSWWEQEQRDTNNELATTDEELDLQLQRSFALPTPAREVLLTVVVNILSNKGPIRAISNTSIYPVEDKTTGTASSQQQQQHRSLMILHWRVLLKMLLRTAPYLDEHKVGRVPTDSNARQSTSIKRTVQLVRDARHFFCQGIVPPLVRTVILPTGHAFGGLSSQEHESIQRYHSQDCLDKTSNEIWDMVRTDILYHSHTNACYRASILLYLFQPTRCTEQYYLRVLPDWFHAWTNIDRCPEYDFLWLAMFCRARKHVSPDHYDWGPIRRRLLTNSQYWLQLPIGGVTMDKSFPRVANPRSRSCPPRLKVFAGAASSYEEGIDFVAKVAKLLVTGLGTGQTGDDDEGNNNDNGTTKKKKTTVVTSQGTTDVLQFMNFVTPYFHPSNLGSWTFTLGAFLHYFAYELCCRVGIYAGRIAMERTYPAMAKALAESQPGTTAVAAAIPHHEMVALVHVLLPLCQQSIYSKNGHVGRAGEAAMLYLVQIDPVHTVPAIMDFATRALDISAVNLSHQAPSALSALTRLVQPSLRGDPSILLARLPEILRLSLPGIDSNDQNKTIRTLILYRSLTSWFPVGGRPETWCSSLNEATPMELDDAYNHDDDRRLLLSKDGTMSFGTGLYDLLSAYRKSPEYLQAIEELPATSLMRAGALDADSKNVDVEMHRLLLDEAISAVSDWALEFLDRVFGLLRATGEREKAGKAGSGTASRHSAADVHQARNSSRVLKECLLQVFAAMDDEVHALAVRSVVRFLEEETHPNAAKDASLLCQSAAAARAGTEGGRVIIRSQGLDAFVPVLTHDLSHHSTKTVMYRLRCLAGAVRNAGGEGLMKHRAKISEAIDFALSSDDRHLVKIGCKLFRHTLSTLSESYPVSSCNRPSVFLDTSSPIGVSLGRSAQLHGDAIIWHVPDGECINFAWELLKTHVSARLDLLRTDTGGEDGCRSKLLNSVEVQELRRCLRIIRYTIRGGASILLDSVDGISLDGENCVPYERSSHRLLDCASPETKEALLRVRGRLCSFLVVLSSVIASETLYPDAILSFPEDDPYRKTLPLISSDPKVCKETCDIALLLLTRRGAAFRSQEARTIWKAQKQLATDFSLSAQFDYMVESLQNAGLYGECRTIRYKDGEDAGKTVPRRLLVSRVHLFHDSLQRNASFEVPRRLRRNDRESNSEHRVVFNARTTLGEMIQNLEDVLTSCAPPLDTYEGIVDGLYALCCHSNTQVRGSSISVIDYATTRFGWLVGTRVPRLLAAISLKDQESNGKFGIPSCALLVDKVNQQGKRKRLAEAIKGVCSILSLPRAIKHVLWSEKMRFRFIETICSTNSLISLMPTEDTQKTVHYLQSVFSPFRSKFYDHPRCSRADYQFHDASLVFALDILAEKSDTTAENENSDEKAPHWRKLLLAGWCLLTLVDKRDVEDTAASITTRTWSTCFRILENEKGQPLQRVSLGLFGRLLLLSTDEAARSFIQERVVEESFCRILGEALVFDHREDSSVGGGHSAQWAVGVEDIVRDAARNVAPRTLFPFQRTSQSLGSFKITHCQLVESVLKRLSPDAASAAVKQLLNFSKEMAGMPPSEDQRNQQITSAEIFAGVLGAYLRGAEQPAADGWTDDFLPFLDDVMGKIPFSLSGAYFDAIRYALQFCTPISFYPLTAWLADKIRSTLWQPSVSNGDVEMEDAQVSTNGSSSHRTEGFTNQSKWLYLLSAVLIEMDESEIDGLMSKVGWYSRYLTAEGNTRRNDASSLYTVEELEQSWQLVTTALLPRLTTALGHPFDSCRDHISRCLFRICYCHRKRSRRFASSGASSLSGCSDKGQDPGATIVSKLATLATADDWSFNDRYNALSTARRFISYCVHLGEAKFEYSDYVIPLLPLAFEALKSTMEEEINENTSSSPEENAAKSALEAEVIKAYRFTIAEVSVAAVISYGSSEDITRVLDVVASVCQHDKWQVRHASANFLRCFQGAHKFLFEGAHAEKTMAIVADLLADERREVSSAAMAALTGILAASSTEEVARLVKKYSLIASRSKMKKPRKGASPTAIKPEQKTELVLAKEQKRARNQQISVFFLCAAVMAQPYETPPYVPEALQSISSHSFERNAPLGVRDTVKKCCAEYKRTHMTDNWELHRKAFSQEQLEALDDVVSTPHYYA